MHLVSGSKGLEPSSGGSLPTPGVEVIEDSADDTGFDDESRPPDRLA
jgi:hypothetical protein